MLTMNSVKILHAVRSAITAIAELLVELVILQVAEMFSRSKWFDVKEISHVNLF